MRLPVGIKKIAKDDCERWGRKIRRLRIGDILIRAEPDRIRQAAVAYERALACVLI